MTWLHGVNQNGMGKRVIQTRRTQWHTQRHSVPLCAAWARSLSLRRSLSPRPSMSHSHWFWEATRIGSVGNRDSKATTCVCVFVCVCVFNVCLFLSFGLNASLACIASWRATSEKGPTAVLMALGNTHTHTRAHAGTTADPPNQPTVGRLSAWLAFGVRGHVRAVEGRGGGALLREWINRRWSSKMWLCGTSPLRGGSIRYFYHHRGKQKWVVIIVVRARVCV